jgi:hypothetical protein
MDPADNRLVTQQSVNVYRLSLARLVSKLDSRNSTLEILIVLAIIQSQDPEFGLTLRQ